MCLAYLAHSRRDRFPTGYEVGKSVTGLSCPNPESGPVDGVGDDVCHLLVFNGRLQLDGQVPRGVGCVSEEVRRSFLGARVHVDKVAIQPTMQLSRHCLRRSGPRRGGQQLDGALSA